MNKSILHFISNLSLHDFPYERIDGCLSALKYISNQNGLNYKVRKKSHYKEIKVLSKNNFEILKFIIDNEKELILFPIRTTM